MSNAPQIRGKVIQPSDDSYEEARQVFNGMIQRRPRLIARCLDVTDVVSCVNWGRKKGLPVSIRGGGHNVDEDETAFSYRDTKYSMVIIGIDDDPANAETIRNWTVDYWEALHPYSAGGAYVNAMMDEGEERVRATYRDNYERLTQIKAKYDPDNFFSINQNIRPLAVAP